MDQYFEGYEMTEERKCKFTKLRLVRQARLYWGNVERFIRQRGDVPIVTWREMKLRLREKYLPMSYHQRLLDQVARDAERFNRGPVYHRPDPPRTSAPSQQPGPSQVRPSRPNPSTPLIY